LQILVLEEAGWVVKWRQEAAHSLDVNSVEWAGPSTLVTAGGCARAQGGGAVPRSFPRFFAGDDERVNMWQLH
jgi:hypothetical protein